MASSGHFDPSQTYNGYKAVEALDPSCTECLKNGKNCFQPYKLHHFFVGKKPCQCPGALISNIRQYLWMTGSRQRDVARWTNVGGPIPIGGSEEDEVVSNSIGHKSSTSPSQPASRIFQSQVIPSTPISFQPVLSTIPSSIPPPSPNPLAYSPALVSPVRPSPIPQPRNSPIVISQQLQTVASSRRRREDQSPLPFPPSQVFQQREYWPIQITREYPNMVNNGQDSAARLFRRLNRNSREVITYAYDRMYEP
ncbi:hypothetical protein O181_124307 [Austropuccinia psidii MF-1]|uniref:Uncharacterized protein n=1 Tax=Austropuccinia psidii MF-1 TaxID=1389203 RepID=A0A9Q3KPF5_9BASI|nr:hypothetical protein [Austropuccinia psidii MF-1]